MEIFAISFVVMALAALGMALGLIAGRRPIVSGCASLTGPDAGCTFCGGVCGGDDVRDDGPSRHRQAPGRS